MKTRLVVFTRGRCSWADEAAADYHRRLCRYAPFEELHLRPSRGAPDSARLEDARRLLDRRRRGERMVLLDERGVAIDSPGLAAVVGGTAREGRDLLLCIGGPEGHHETLRRQADMVLCLSALTLNHQVARVLLLEQLYRCWTILRGEPYHRGRA